MKRKSFSAPRSGNKKKTFKKKVRGENWVSLQPPRFNSQPVHSIRLRGLCTGNADPFIGTVTVSELGYMIGIIGTSATTSVAMTTIHRLKKVELWSPAINNTSGTPAAGPQQSVLSFPQVITTEETAPPISSTGLSFDPSRPAYSKLIPKEDQYPGMWHNSGVGNNTVLFNVIAASGSVLDVECEYVLCDDRLPANSVAIVGGTAGQIYHKIITLVTGTVWTILDPLSAI